MIESKIKASKFFCLFSDFLLDPAVCVYSVKQVLGRWQGVSKSFKLHVVPVSLSQLQQ